MKENIVTLAHTWDETRTNPVGWWMSEKLDGMRAVWNGSTLLSRNNLPINCPDWWSAQLPKDRKLDGELYLGRGNFQKVVSVCRTHVPNDDAWKRVMFMVFDVIDDGTAPWIERFRVDIAAPVIPVEHHECKSIEHLEAFYSSIVDNGGEGVMIRHPEQKFIIGRSNNLLKVKPELDVYGEVIDHEKGQGKYENMLGALLCRVGDKFVRVGSGLTDVERTEKYAPKIGSKIKIKYTSLTDDGNLRFPRFGGLV